MKFRMTVSDETQNDSWIEDEDRPGIDNLEQAQKWAEDTIARFNNTLRPLETARTLINVEDLHDNETEKHVWGKTNLVTIVGNCFGFYDTMECKDCGITGKRHGVSAHGVKRDPEFKAPGYSSCRQAKILLERRRRMRERRRNNEAK